jgi:hypothetical protein
MVAALAAAAPATGCKEKIEVVVNEPLTCLSVRGDPTPLGNDREYAFSVHKGGKSVVDGGVRVVGNPIGIMANPLGTLAVGPVLLEKSRPCLVDAVQRGEEVTGTVEQDLLVSADGEATSSGITTAGAISQALRECLVERSIGPGFPKHESTRLRIRWSLASD